MRRLMLGTATLLLLASCETISSDEDAYRNYVSPEVTSTEEPGSSFEQGKAIIDRINRDLEPAAAHCKGFGKTPGKPHFYDFNNKIAFEVPCE